MKLSRQSKILDNSKYDIETQEELTEWLMKEGYNVTQATVSRDIRELKLTKVAMDGGRQKYIAIQKTEPGLVRNIPEYCGKAFIHGYGSEYLSY